MIPRFAFAVVFLSAVVSIDAFTVRSTQSNREASILKSSRRDVLEYSAAAILGGVLVAAPAAFAEGFEDLSMPSEEQQKTTEVC